MTTLSDRVYKTLIGVEFKDDAIIIACLKNDFTGLNLLSSSTFPLRDNDETIKDIDRFVAQYVRDANNVFVSIPNEWAVIKFIEVPPLKGKGKDALIQMMKFEIERHIPYQIEDVFYDFQVVEKKEATNTVLFVSVHKEKIEYVKKFLEKLSLIPQVITLSHFAILNSIEFSEVTAGGWQDFLGVAKKSDILGRKNETIMSFFINRDNVNFTLLKGGFCVHFNLFTLDQNKPLDVIVDDISSELSALPTRFSNEKINKLLLSGTVTLVPELAGALGAKLGINAQTINPVSKLLKGGETIEAQELSASIGACYLGLGKGHLRINLLPHKADAMIRKTGALVTKISILLILFLIIGVFTGELVNDKRFLTEVDEKLKENEPQIKVIEKLTANLNAFEQQRNFLLDVKKDDILLDILAELARILPADVWLRDFSYREIHGGEGKDTRGELIIGGYALSSSALISILEDSLFFEKVEFVGRITRRQDKEGFKIKAVIMKPAK